MNQFQGLFGNAQDATGYDALAWIAFRIAFSALLTTVVALLYRHSRSPESRQPGFAHTLVMLGPLIAMVTMAVGQNVAAAFTLVGTLAIVRFRYSVRDTRDMAYVIFSVAIGMAMGSFNIVVAICGVTIIGLVILILRQFDSSRAQGEQGLLRIVITPPETDASLYAPTLARYTSQHSVVGSSINRTRKRLDLRITVRGLDPKRSPTLLAELMEIPEIVRATFRLENEA